MNKAGFITYNSLPEFQSGWLNSPDGSRSALIVQDTNGRGSLEEGRRTRTEEEIKTEIARLWERVEASLSDLDHLVVYIGSNGSERAIELVTKMPAEKLTFIGCSCGIVMKEAMIQSVGLHNAKRLLCECGGHRTMVAMIRSFLKNGSFGLQQ